MANQKVNIHEVARLAGVSKSTVSRVVSDRGGSVSSEAREAVNAAIKELGYSRNTMAASLRTQKTYMILVMVPDIANPFWSEVARAAQDGLEAEGYSVVVGNTDWSEEREARYFALARSGRFDGLVLNSVTGDMGTIKALGPATVLIGERSERTEVDTVGTDTRAATRLALEYLYELGHRRIAIATSEYGTERVLSRRRRAYEEFVAEKGLPSDSELAISVRLSAEGGRELVRRFLALRDRPDAVFCGNDILAIAALDEFKAAGLEPGRDVSLVGMDDIPAAAQCRPALTTVRKPRALIGSMAAARLLKRIEDPDAPTEKTLFPGELVARGSVADMRKAR